MHELTIQDIQTTTIDLLNHSKNSIQAIRDEEEINDEKGSLSDELLTKQIGVLENELGKVDELEMVIAVVGTMKAGKSTTINAIVGQEILPNRAYPMTAIPTLVTHKKGYSSPKLSFTKRAPLVDMSKEVTEKLKDVVNKGDSTGFHNQSEAKEVVQKLMKSGSLEFEESYQGQQEIFNFLKELNDLMRLAKELDIEPPYDKYENIDDFPKIEVEFFHLKESAGEAHGKLSILDTPGPNEYGKSKNFKQIFQNQLSKASAVLLVVDYTQVGSNAGGEVSKEIDKMGEVLLENTYVLLNKYDNSNKNDEKKEDIIKNFSSQFMKGKIPEERIFPVSAFWGFLANLVLRELEDENEIDPNGEWITEFGEEFMGRRWKKKINDVEEVTKCAEEGWEDSNFDKPLKKVIQQVHTEAAFKSLESAIDKLSDSEVMNGVNAYYTSFTNDIKTIEEAIECTKTDIKKIGDLKKKLSSKFEDESAKIKNAIYKEFDRESKTLIENTRSIFSITNKEQKDKLVDRLYEEWFNNIKNDSNKKEEYSFTIQHEFRNRPNIRLYGKNLVDYREIKDKQKQQVLGKIKEALEKTKPLSEQQNNGKLKFEDEDDANSVVTDVNAIIKSSIQGFNANVIEMLECNINNYSLQVNKLVGKEVSDILNKARKKIGDSGFKVDFNFSSINRDKISSDDIEGIKHRITNETEKRKYNHVGSTWVDKGLNWLNDDWGREDCEYNENVYTLKIDTILDKVINLITNHKQKLESNISGSLDEVLAEVNQHINELKEYLEQYRQSMISGLEMQQGNQKNNEIFKNKIKKIIDKINYDSKDIKDVKEQLILLESNAVRLSHSE